MSVASSLRFAARHIESQEHKRNPSSDCNRQNDFELELRLQNVDTHEEAVTAAQWTDELLGGSPRSHFRLPQSPR